MASKSKSVSYCDFINFKDPSMENPQTITYRQKGSSIFKNKKNSQIHNFNNNQQSNLERSALMKIHYERQRQQAQAIQDVLSQSSSNFIFSRENTPANFNFPKKKAKHKTVGSELFDIQSKGSNMKKQQQAIFDGLVLQPRLVGLSEVVYSEVMGKEKKINPKLIHNWKDCLLPEDKQQIFGKNAPYSFSRIFPLNELQRGFGQIYGSGKKRCLRVGEQSLLIHHMEKYLEKCSKDVMKIARKDFDIISDILKNAKLLELEQLPTCMKQIQLLWKILATQWRYSGQLDFGNRLLEGALINGKSNFLDLRRDNALTSFLLANSNYGKRSQK